MIIPYLGEKSKFAKFIIPYIPNNILTYIEPFSGMYGIFFSLDFSEFENTKFIYNDKNYLNYNLFNQLKNNSEFIDQIVDIKVDYELYKKSLFNLLKEKNNSKLSIDWLIVLCCSSPYEIGKDSWRGDMEFEIFKLKYKYYKESIDKITDIHNLDYKEIIKKYDSFSSFFYVDPPYKGREKFYINHDFNINSHFELAEILNNIKGKFLLSYYYFDGIEELYKDFEFISKKTIMGTEYLIKNY
jgi:DNA adenine methylase